MAVIVLGSINADLIAAVHHRPAGGETVIASGLTVAPGGKGANQALAARRLGADVALLGAVGQDGFAEQALHLLREAGVDLSGVIEAEDATTGIAMILLDASGENSITVVSGANHAVGQRQLERLEALLTPRDTLAVQLEIPLPVVQRAVALARAKGTRVILDPAPAPDTFPADLLDVDVFLPNRHEAEQLVGYPIEGIQRAQGAARQLHARGARIAVVKLGGDGVVWASAEGVFAQPAAKVQAVDTTGAGDAFAGACAACLDRGMPIVAAIEMATRAAALATTRIGAQPSLPWLADVETAGTGDSEPR
jgi:ribokinase